MAEDLSLGEAAKQIGVSVDTLRRYQIISIPHKP